MSEKDLIITVNDLSNCVNIIDYAAGQGIFKGWDNIRNVLELRDKLSFIVEEFNKQEALKKQEEKPIEKPAPRTRKGK